MKRINSHSKVTHYLWGAVFLLIYSLYQISNTSASSHDTKMCDKILRSNEKPINALFYVTNSGELEILEQNKLFSKNIKGTVLYYLRNQLHTPGGVLVVKTAHGTNSKDRRVKLKRGRLSKKDITKECIQEDVRTKKFFKKYKNEDKSKYASTTVGYNIFQTYAARKKDKDAKKIDKDDYNKLKGWHFRFKNPYVENTKDGCSRTDHIKGNRIQSSLRISNTGSQEPLNNASRLIRQFIKNVTTTSGKNDKEEKAEKSNWTVTLVAFDKVSKDSSRACIKLTIPELKKAKLIRINDLSYRPRGVHWKDIEILGR